MNRIIQSTWVEILKARRSNVPLLTFLAFSIAPFAGGFFMLVLKDPDLAQKSGLISTKAQIVVGTADWPTYLSLLSQIIAVGGIILFGFVATWVFGREYSDHTIKDLLALPTSRSTIVMAKFVVIMIWVSFLALFVIILGLGIGVAVRLPSADATVFLEGTTTIIVTTCLTVVLVTPVAFCANVGRGYLVPLGFAVFALILAQLVAAAGWGEYFPWSIPALRAGMSGPQSSKLGIVSYMLVILTSLLGTVCTLVWWEYVDQTG